MCEVSMLLSWISIFGLIKPTAAQANTNPSCIRIIGDVNEDSEINKYIAQDFNRVEDEDPSLRAKYVSRDKNHQFGYQHAQWFLMPINSIYVKFLQSPVQDLEDPIDLLNPLRIGKCGWKRWVDDEIWEPVTNKIIVQRCQLGFFNHKQQESCELSHEDNSSQTTQVGFSSTTARPSTKIQPTAQMTRESITDCTEITTNLTFFANSNEIFAEIYFKHKNLFDDGKNTFWLARELFNGTMKIVMKFNVSCSLYL